MDLSIYLILAALVFVLNLVPWLVPPTWLTLVVFSSAYHLSVIPTVIIGVTFAALGRVGLYLIARRYIFRFIPKRSQENVEYLGQFLSRRKSLSVPLFLIYTLLPISTSELFIAGGLAKYSLGILITCFIIGRSISYTFWVSQAFNFAQNASQLLSSNYANLGLFITQILGLLILYAFTRISWKRLLAHLD